MGASDTAPAGYLRNTRGTAKPGFLYGSPIYYEDVEGQAMFQGDIILSEAQMRAPGASEDLAAAKAAAAGKPNSFERWPDNTVYYEIDPELSADQKWWIEDDLLNLSSNLDLVFIKRTTEKDYIRYTKSTTSCSSPVGRQGLMQPINLAPWCDAGSIYHETMHALGLWHEQSRADRDNFINVDYNNLDNDIAWRMNWDKYSFNSGFDFGPFDYHSVMLYDSYAGALDPKVPVLSRKDGSTWQANREYPSEGDILALTAMYPTVTLAPFKARDIGAGADGSVFKVSSARILDTPNYRIYKYDADASVWVEFVSPGAIRIDVDPKGNPWIVQASGKAMFWSGTAWKTASGLTKVMDIGIGSNGAVYALSAQVLFGKNYSVWRWTGTAWAMMPVGSGLRLSVDEKGHPWTVNDVGAVSRWTGSKWSSLFFPYGAGGKDISVGMDGTVYVIGGEMTGSDFRLYQKSAGANLNGAGQATFFCVGSVLGLNVDAYKKGSAWVAKADQSTQYVTQ